MTKVYRLRNGELLKPKATTSKWYSSRTYEIEELDELYTVIKEASKDPRKSLMRGAGPKSVLKNVQRLKWSEDRPDGVFREVPTAWVCFDFDSAIVPGMEESPKRYSHAPLEWLISQLPVEFHNVSYIYHWSSSAAVEYDGRQAKKGTNAHIFFYLSRGVEWEQFKAWFKDVEVVTDESVFRTVTPAISILPWGTSRSAL
ncbi:MAG: hypothetical protein ACREYF_28095 [Gammaproteobacteria bacterium]